MNKPLKILVTRPADQADNLCRQIKQNGGEAILFPTLEIHPVADKKLLCDQLKLLPAQDFVVFLSPNAVKHTASWIQQLFPIWPQAVKIMAVGPSTANRLRAHDLPVDFLPREDFNSEGLLALPNMQKIDQKRIMLIRGDQGRELLPETLKERGAIITDVISYRREIPQNVPLLDFSRDTIDIILSTSISSLENLVAMMTENSRHCLKNMSLLVSSSRIAKRAQEIGFVKSPVVADNATDAALITALLDWQETCYGTKNTKGSLF